MVLSMTGRSEAVGYVNRSVSMPSLKAATMKGGSKFQSFGREDQMLGCEMRGRLEQRNGMHICVCVFCRVG